MKKERKMELSIKSIATFNSIEKLEERLEEIGFTIIEECTIIADSKFWNKKTYRVGEEVVHISDELGPSYFHDPVITICGTKETITDLTKTI
tara:strand:+ start:539 stop:814 length:276 start_codon:yes stop_codon:yes gene_type:complete